MKCFTVLLVCVATASSALAQAQIGVDTNTHYQTIEGWGHGGGIFSNLNYGLALTEGQDAADTLNCQYLDYIANDLGLTGSRMWEVGPRIDGTGIDFNGDCDSLDWSRFQANTAYSQSARYAVYFRTLVEAQGHTPSFYSSPTYPTFATMFKPWVLNHPGERALQMWADALWWKQQGIDINYAVVQNEPNGAWTPQILSDDIDAVGPRFASHTLTTKVQYAEGVDPHTSWNYDTTVHRDPKWWSYVGRLSYHRYGTDDPYRGYLADSAAVHHIATGQTEMANPTVEDIVSDLVQGNCTYWEVGFSGSNTLTNTKGNTNWTPSSTYFRMRQLLHYVRPGDIRIGASSADSMVQVVAFEGKFGITTVVINHRAQQTVTITGLRAGTYGLSQSAGGASAFQEYGVKTVGNNGTISFVMGGSGQTATLYPYVGKNHPPTIQSWSANPGYIVAPATSAVLTATASDAEGDSLIYQWSLVQQPAGAGASFATPKNPTTTVTGLTQPGLYVFAITVSDGTNTSRRKLFVEAYATNPPPVLWQSGFRFPAPYGLVFANPEDTTHANIELPTSSAVLQVGISDLANSDFTGRGKWTLVSQPAGANANLDTTIYIFISIRANVSNMTVPGDYVFQCNVTNPGHADLIDRIICTVHPASAGPVVTSIIGQPITLPQTHTNLTVTASDTSGQLLRYWWYTKSAPAGAKPVFDHQGRASCTVDSLTVPGTYTFTVRVFDDLHMATKDVSLVVTQHVAKGILALTPHELHFGYVDSGSHASLPALMRDTGDAPLSITEISTAPPFFVDSAPPRPFTLQPGDSMVFKIGFAPTDVGIFKGMCRVVSGDGSSDTIALDGVGRAVGQESVLQPHVTDAGFTVSPNPATDHIVITSRDPDAHIAGLSITNMLGQKVLDAPISASDPGTCTISLGRLPAGLYMISFVDRDKVWRVNVLKQ